MSKTTRRSTRGLAAIGALGLLLFLPAPAPAERIEAVVAAGHPTSILWVEMLAAAFITAADRNLDRSPYTLKWREFYGASLVKVTEELSALKGGVADIAPVSTVFTPEELPLQNISYITPFATENPALVLETVDRLYKEVPDLIQAWEKHGVQYIDAGYPSEDYVLVTRFPMRRLVDLKGRKIGTARQALSWLKGTGAVGIEGDITLYRKHVETGLIEGAILPATAAATTRLYEVAPYVTRVGLGAQYVGAVVAAKAWHDDLAPEVRTALRQAAAAYRRDYLAELDRRVGAAFETMALAGAQVSTLPDGERRKWAAALPPLARTWAQDLDRAGAPGSRVLARYMQALRDGGARPLRDWDRE